MKTLILSAITAGALFVTACGSNSTTDKTETGDSTSVHTAGTTYTCSMHPEVVSDKPGKCPKCNMDLVAKEGTEDHSGHKH